MRISLSVSMDTGLKSNEICIHVYDFRVYFGGRGEASMTLYRVGFLIPGGAEKTLGMTVGSFISNRISIWWMQ